MGFSLKDFLEESIAQFNPLDGGKTAATVRRARSNKATPAQTLKKKPTAYIGPYKPMSDQQIRSKAMNDSNFRSNVKSVAQGQFNRGKTDTRAQNLFKAAETQRVYDRFKLGELSRPQFETQQKAILNSTFNRQPTLQDVMKRDMSFGESLHQGLGNAIMQVAPQRIIGSGAEFIGRATGKEGLENLGEGLNEPFRDYSQHIDQNAQGLGRVIGTVAGGLLTLPLAPAGKLGMAFRGARYGTPTAADTSYAIEQGGGSRGKAIAGGLTTGLIGGALGTVGAEKVLNPANKLAKNVTTRLVQAGAYEGAEEGFQQGVDNFVAQKTYDPNRGLLDNVLESSLVGAAGGIAGRGLVEGGSVLNDPYNRAQVENTVSKTQLAAVSAKSDPEYKRLDTGVTKALRNASKTTGKEKQNFITEARELLRLRNNLVKEYSQVGAAGKDVRRRDLSGKQLSMPNSELENSPESIASLIRKTDEDIGQFTNEQDSRDYTPEDFGAVATNPNSRNAKKLEKAVQNDTQITEAVRKAQREGTEFNYYAEKGESGRSVAIQPFDLEKHTIQSGLVVDSKGRVLGNHVKVNPTGVEVNVGGRAVNMSDIIGDISKIENSYKVGQTMERNISRVFKDKAKAKKVYDFVIGNKLDNETKFRTELRSQRQALGDRTKGLMKAKPSGVDSKTYKESIFNYIEGKTKRSDLVKEYGQDTVKQIDAYKKQTRTVYDELLERVNQTFERFGEPTVPKRKDYLTHISELNGQSNFAGELYGSLKNSILGESEGKTRGGVPAEISGRTGEFEPRKKWNPFFQQRTGSQEFKKDPFEAVDAYLEPSLYNIHMTESAVRARAVETAIRTAQKFEAEFDPRTVKEGLQDAFKEKFNDTNVDKVVNAWQEYANALSGKTNAIDRAIIDKTGDSGQPALKAWQGLQRIGGRATILGNAQSVLSQTLGIPSTIADAGLKNTLVGLKNLASNNDVIKKSRFVTSRLTDVASPIRSNASKAMDALGVPLKVVEQEFVKMTWYAEYEAAKQKGFEGDNAIREADRLTERVVAGRGIADRPEIYRSTVANGLLQYTLEVNAQNQKFFKDFNYKQRAKYVAGAFVMNSIMASVTGFEPLPDFLNAGIETLEDFGEEDDRSFADKLGAGVQRFTGEAANMNPFFMAGANVLPQELRKNVFGEDSDVGRFDGQAAPIQVIERGIKSGKNLIEGNVSKAAEEAVRGFVPAGNQIRKSATGAAALDRGYAVDGGGNPTFPVSNDPINATKSLLFGPNSTKAARTYYDTNQRGITGKDDLAALEQSGNPAQTVSDIQNRRYAAREDTVTEKTQQVQASGNDYEQIVDAYSKRGDGIKVGDYDQEELKASIQRVNTEARQLFEGRSLPTDGIKFDSKFAEEYARFKKNSAGKDAIAKDKAESTFLKNTYKSQLDPIVKSFYNLGDEDMKEMLVNKDISLEQMDEVIRVDNILTQAGLQEDPQVGIKLRRLLGYSQIAGSSSSGSSGSRRSSGRRTSSSSGRGKFDYKLNGFTSSNKQTRKTLTDIVREATLA